MRSNWKLLLLPTILSGCAATTWNHPTASASQFSQESAQCQMFAQASNPSTATPYNPYLTPMQQSQAAIAQGSSDMGRAFGIQAAYKNCMNSKGYYEAR